MKCTRKDALLDRLHCSGHRSSKLLQMLTVRTCVQDYNSFLYEENLCFNGFLKCSTEFHCARILWTVSPCKLHISFTCSFTETSKEKKTKVDPKLVFPLKLWLLSWLPRERKRWNSATGLPQSDDKEDWVQLGERKQPGSPEEVPHTVYAQFFSIRFPYYLGAWNRLDLVAFPLTTISQKKWTLYSSSK